MKPRSKSSRTDRIYAALTALLSSSAFLFLFVILGVLLVSAYPSAVVNGFHFFVSNQWSSPTGNPTVIIDGFKELQGSLFGVSTFFIGTLLTSAIAIAIGVPVSLGIAVLLSQYVPKFVAAPISFAVELLAGIPSIIYGLWAVAVLQPILVHYVEPSMAATIGFIPGFSEKLLNEQRIPGLLDSGLILALMIVPIVASISRDSMVQTPRELAEGGTALGMTRWEVTRKIVLPFAKTGIVGATMLGLGRALGETMAVALVSGSASYLPISVYGTINTMAAFMANNYGDIGQDPTGMTASALAELALLLLATTMVVNVFARVIVRRAGTKTDQTTTVGI